MSIKKWMTGFSEKDRQRIMAVVERVDDLEKQNKLLQAKLTTVTLGLKETQTLVQVIAAAQADMANDMNVIYTTLQSAVEMVAGGPAPSSSKKSVWALPSIYPTPDDDDPEWN